MTTPIFPQLCARCKHWMSDNRGWGKCSAFPKGIPEKILLNKKKHIKPLPDQKNDIVFEPIEADEDED